MLNNSGPEIKKSNSNSSISSSASNVSASKFQAAHIKGSSSLPIPIREGRAALLPICLGQEYHEKEKLRALINLLTLQQAPVIYVLISGLLYRFSRQVTGGINYEEAYESSKEDGKKWIEQHESIFESSNIQIRIFSWEYWLVQPNYNSIRQSIGDYYATDPAFKQAFDEEAEKFISNFKRNNPSAPIKGDAKDRELCLQYLMEECAVLVLMWQNSLYGYTHYIYPGAISKAIDISFERLYSQKKNKLNENKILFVQTEFSSRMNNSAVQHMSTGLNDVAIKRKIKQLDEEESKNWAERSEVLSNCRIYMLKGASLYVRENIANLIKNRIMIDSSVELELHEYRDLKTTSLIFAPQGKYSANKFEGELLKKYLPTQTTDFKSFSESSIKNSIITLKTQQEEEAQKWESIAKSMSNADPIQIFEAIKFYYSCLVYKEIAPDASIILVGGEKGDKLYFVCVSEAVARDNGIQLIKDYLFNINSNLAIKLEDIKIPKETSLQPAIHIVDPSKLLKLVFEAFGSSVLRKDSVDTINSEEIRSAQSSPSVTPEKIYRSLSQQGMIAAPYQGPLIYRQNSNRGRGGSLSSTSPTPSPFASPSPSPRGSSSRSLANTSPTNFFSQVSKSPPLLALPPGASASTEEKNKKGTQKKQAPGFN